MKQRITTVALFGPLFLFVLFLGSIPFSILSFALAIICFYELLKMYSKKRSDFSLILYSLIYIGLGFYCFAFLRSEEGFILSLFALLIIWSTDSGAYFIGKKIGKRKLAPSISPNKTIEGSIGGIFVALLVGLSFNFFFSVLDSFLVASILIFLISIFGQLGDLFESKIKRNYNVKDSGTLLPGHGGIFDRFDSMIPVFIFLTAISVFTNLI